MKSRLPPLHALRAFEAAARHLSFKKAAEELHVTPAAVSQQIKALEAHLGVALFRRLTRALELTDAGQAMLPKLQEGFDSLAAAVERTRRHAGGGVLSVCAPPSFAARWLMPRLQVFTTAHADIELRLATSQAMIDNKDAAGAGGEPAGLREDGHALEIRFGRGRYGRLHTERLFGVAFVAVCSPRLRAGKRPLVRPEDLRHHVLIHDDTIPDLDERPTWAEWLRKAGVTTVDAGAGPHFSNSGLAIEAAIDGLGVALAPRPLVSADVAEGRLVLPFDIAVPSRYAYWLVCPQTALARPAAQSFREWLLAEAAKEERG
jgi:LysR family glycine cleavage system transcriptional activator